MNWLRAVKLAGRLCVEAVRTEWAHGPHHAVDAVLADTTQAHAGREPAGAVRPVDRAWAAAGEDPRWRALTERFGLTTVEAQFLALLCAIEVDPRWRRVLGYLDDDRTPADPTPAAAAALFGWAPGERPMASGALARWELATPITRDLWTTDPDVVAYLCDVPGWETFWPGVTHSTPADVLYPETLSQLEQAARHTSEIELVGPAGSGRRTLFATLCQRLGRRPLLICPEAPAVKALRTAKLLHATPIWVDAEHVPDPELTLLARTERDPRPATRMTFALPALSAEQRARLWGATPVSPTVREWALTPAEIHAAASAGTGGEHAVAAVARRRLGGVGSALMTRIDHHYTWDDLVVADHVKEQLEELQRHVSHRTAVLDEWGFRRLTPRSRGVTALFAGPSGTGKTMAAQVLAHRLDLELFQVDLAEVVNKYIGETEKRLAQVFDECERGNVMVLFDEADALFGQRTRVREAHDRFANIEIDYLLQRMESFDGVAILATNRRGDLDPAFVRRIRIIVDFLAPTPAERRRLWDLAVPSDARFANGIDRAWLADELQLTGAEIKSVALSAAFRAHAAGERIDTEHVLAAARRELAKKGTVVR